VFALSVRTGTSPITALPGATLFGFPFGSGDWNPTDAYTYAAPHFRRVFSRAFSAAAFVLNGLEITSGTPSL
jgi:hypothetical protein